MIYYEDLFKTQINMSDNNDSIQTTYPQGTAQSGGQSQSADGSTYNLSNQGESTVDVVSPDQTSIFEQTVAVTSNEEVTRMEIPHTEQTAANYAAPVEEESVARRSEEFTTGAKVKILATLVIVAVAGYAAYWVQEPVQLKTDVLQSDSSAALTTSTPVNDVKETAEASANSVSVDVSLFGFDPADLKVEKGTTVVWTNTSTQDQTIIGSAADGESFASPVMTSGKSYSYKFDKDADFQYYSTYNPALKASLKVGTGDTATEATSTDNTAPETTDASVLTLDTTNQDVAPTTDATFSTPEMIDTPTVLETASADTTTKTDEAVASDTATVVAGASKTENLKPAAAEVTPNRLSNTGPAENLYAVVLLGIAWVNRKKLARALKK